MYAQIEKKKNKENNDRVIANSVVQNKGTRKQSFKFINNLSGPVIQSKLQERNSAVQFSKKSSDNVYKGFVNNQNCVVQLVSHNRDNFTLEQRLKILAKNAQMNGGYYTCEHCGFMHKLVEYATLNGRRIGDGSFHIDHVKAASKGGRALIRNGRVLCGTCNTSKGNRAKVGKITGIVKYSALHGKSKAKNYIRRPSKKRRLK